MAQLGPLRRLIAVRKAGVLSYLHHDHLGSTKAISGTTGGPMKYYPFGSAYQEVASPPTDNLYTGQKRDLSTELYYYGARYYSVSSGTFTQPDSIVPQPGNPQSLNRFAYALNNPLRYADPTGHDPLDKEWEKQFSDEHGRDPTDEDRQDRLFSVIYAGNGEGEYWTPDDWTFYLDHKEALWSGKMSWPGAESPGLNRFANHVARLSGWYSEGETLAFAKAMGLLFAGIPYTGHLPMVRSAGTKPPYLQLKEGNQGWDPYLVDDDNPSHHYAGLFYAGYMYSEGGGRAINIGREAITWAASKLGVGKQGSMQDVRLGNIAARHGGEMRDTYRSTQLVAYLIHSLAVVDRYSGV